MAPKAHRKPKAGRKANKKKAATKAKAGKAGESLDAGISAPSGGAKAPHLASKGRAMKQRARTAEKEQRRLHVPVLHVVAPSLAPPDGAPAADAALDEPPPPPLFVLVHGPPGVGKSTLLSCLIKHYTRQNVADVAGPITVVAGKKRRVTLLECPQDLCSMIDAAKVADLVLLMVDGAYGFEMETFEFLMLLQQSGMPKVMGVLTHLDGFKDNKRLKSTKKALKHRFEQEVAVGAKLFYLSGLKHGRYLKREVLNLARFVALAKTRPLSWRLAHPYLVADRFEDMTPAAAVAAVPQCDRSVTLYGYLRGCPLRHNQRVHLAGAGDFTALEALPDPCPLPEQVKKRGLSERERRVYAPMAAVGGLLYDKDATYVDIPDWKVQYTAQAAAGTAPADAHEARF